MTKRVGNAGCIRWNGLVIVAEEKSLSIISKCVVLLWGVFSSGKRKAPEILSAGLKYRLLGWLTNDLSMAISNIKLS